MPQTTSCSFPTAWQLLPGPRAVAAVLIALALQQVQIDVRCIATLALLMAITIREQVMQSRALERGDNE